MCKKNVGANFKNGKTYFGSIINIVNIYHNEGSSSFLTFNSLLMFCSNLIYSNQFAFLRYNCKRYEQRNILQKLQAHNMSTKNRTQWLWNTFIKMFNIKSLYVNEVKWGKLLNIVGHSHFRIIYTKDLSRKVNNMTQQIKLLFCLTYNRLV